MTQLPAVEFGCLERIEQVIMGRGVQEWRIPEQNSLKQEQLKEPPWASRPVLLFPSGYLGLQGARPTTDSLPPFFFLPRAGGGD